MTERSAQSIVHTEAGRNEGSFTRTARSLRVLPYAITIFVSAFLLFQVQPLITKSILPWFGSSAAVWSTALVVFQGLLLAGYVYAHLLTTHFALRTQLFVHAGALSISLAVLPIVPAQSVGQVDLAKPASALLALLVVTIGLPYFALSATTPLLQAWYARRVGAVMPYRLFALSNLASMLALISYPFLVEPYADLRTQAYLWSALYIVFVLACAYVMVVSRHAAPPATPAAQPIPEADCKPTVQLMASWCVLSACASALLSAVTNHLGTNVAPIPLIWIAPLAIYLLTLIATFGSDCLYKRNLLLPWLASALFWMAFSRSTDEGNLHIAYVAPVYLLGLFACCLFCHGELARLRPSQKYSAIFYVMVALGGAVGCVFVAILSPKLFDSVLELPILLFAVAVLSVVTLWHQDRSKFRLWVYRSVLVCGLLLFGAYLLRGELAARAGHVVMARDFYGALQVRDEGSRAVPTTRRLVHGTITHGAQSLNPAFMHVPGAYYSSSSGVGRALRKLQSDGRVRYGVIGLGAGVLAAYARNDDYLRFYEINRTVLDIAQHQFTFLDHARELGADVDVVMGDARLALSRQHPQRYDLLAVDAFSSDAIPFHLLTKESFDVYFRHLKPGGVLAIHISNRYLDLEPVCSRAAQLANKVAVTVEDFGASGGIAAQRSAWVLITSDRTLFEGAVFVDAEMHPTKVNARLREWTDQYSSVWPLIKTR